MNESQEILISIVTPSYNCDAFIKETIESVLTQGVPSFEHIIMDGGSKDKTVDILKSYPHLNWKSEKDNGQSHALNKGFKLVKGEIVGWLNADDTYEPGTFKKVLDFFNTNPAIDCIGTDINIIDEKSKRIGFSASKPFELSEMLVVNTVKQPTVFMRRRMVEKLVGVDESLHYVMDHEFWVRANIEGFKIKYIPNEVFANFRMITGTKSFENAPGFYLEWANTVRNFFKKPLFEHFPNKKAILSEIEGQYYTSLTIKAINEKDRKSALSNLWKALMVNPSLWLNRGVYKFILLIITGKERSLLAKYN
jgi:glycosyltransferase involved in cell wall biosynthesis